MKKKIILFITMVMIFTTGCFLEVPPDFVGKYHKGYAPARMGDYWGIVDSTQKVVVDYDYDYVQEGSDGMFAVCKKKKWGYLNDEFKTTIDFLYDTVRPFYEGLALAFRSEFGWSCINKKGERVLNSFFYLVEENNKNFYILCTRDDYPLYNRYDTIQHSPYCIIFRKKQGQQISNWYKNVFATFNDSCIMVLDDKGFAMLNANNRIVSEYYDDFRLATDSSVVIVQKGEQLALLDMNGKIKSDWYDQMGEEYVITKGNTNYESERGKEIVLGIVTLGISTMFFPINKKPVQMIEYTSFSEGLMMVKKNGKFGYIDKTGTIVIPCKYSDAEDFKKGRAKVELGGKKFVINPSEETLPWKTLPWKVGNPYQQEEPKIQKKSKIIFG